MTDTLTSSASDAGRLISYGIQAAKFRPARDTDYQNLVLRFLADRDFERLVMAIAGGQGLSVIACGRIEGLVLAPTTESVYGIRLADYIALESSDIRLLHGVVQLGIAATAYPTAAALDDSTRIVSISANQVYDRLQRLAEECGRRAGRDDPPEDDPEAERIWHLVARLRPTDTTPDERDTPYNVMGAIRKALRWLTERGLAEEVEGTPDTWRLRDRYRLGVVAASAGAFEALQSLGDQSVSDQSVADATLADAERSEATPDDEASF